MKDLITALLAAKAAGTSSGSGTKGDKGEKGDKGDTGAQGPAGSDANVTADNIAAALGYTPIKPSDIPTALKNPNAITFTGVATGSYDGSTEMSVHIPPATATLEPPLFAPSIEWLEENGDTSKVYVLPDGYLYSMAEGTHANFTNLFDPSSALLNTVRKIDGNVAMDGSVATNLIPITCREDSTNPTVIRIRGVSLYSWIDPNDMIIYHTADQEMKWYPSIKAASYSLDDNGDIVIKAGWNEAYPVAGCETNYKYFSLNASVYGAETPITYADIQDIIITVDQEITYSSGLAWANTGIKYTSSSEISPLQKKKILVIGDSITTDTYPKYSKWVTVLINNGFFPSDGTNDDSVASTGFVAINDGASLPTTENSFVDRLTAISDPETYDLVVVFGGINDFIQGIPMGESGGDKDTYFKPAVDYFFDYLIKNFTNARIAVLSPLRSSNTGKNWVAGVESYYQTEYADYIREVAKKYCLPVLNLTEESGFCPFIDEFKQKWTDSADGLHPNEEYQKTFLAPMIKKFLAGLYGR